MSLLVIPVVVGSSPISHPIHPFLSASVAVYGRRGRRRWRANDSPTNAWRRYAPAALAVRLCWQPCEFPVKERYALDRGG